MRKYGQDADTAAAGASDGQKYYDYDARAARETLRHYGSK